MKERPILMSGPLVRKILAGQKTVTRRPMKPQPEPIPEDLQKTWVAHDQGRPYWWSCRDVRSMVGVDEAPITSLGPYGAEGDRLWVRETFSVPYRFLGLPPRDVPRGSPVWYWADGNPTDGDWTPAKPSIFMPRWASRLLLDIRSVGVERLQDITDGDAKAEGIELHADTENGPVYTDTKGVWHSSARSAFRDSWETIYGSASGWHANPWVWRIEFAAHEILSEVLSDG